MFVQDADSDGDEVVVRTPSEERCVSSTKAIEKASSPSTGAQMRGSRFFNVFDVSGEEKAAKKKQQKRSAGTKTEVSGTKARGGASKRTTGVKDGAEGAPDVGEASANKKRSQSEASTKQGANASKATGITARASSTVVKSAGKALDVPESSASPGEQQHEPPGQGTKAAKKPVRGASTCLVAKAERNGQNSDVAVGDSEDASAASGADASPRSRKVHKRDHASKRERKR